MCKSISCCDATGCDEPTLSECEGVPPTVDEQSEQTEQPGQSEQSAASKDVFGWAVAFAAMQLFLSWCH